jgi:predicted nucleotidyltransferase
MTSKPDVELDVAQIVAYWVTEADEALVVADHLVAKADYSYALFFGHLAVDPMAEVSAAVQRSIRQFIVAVGKERRIAAAYLYGSEARGQAGPWSDIDVAVISPDFGDDLFAAQLALMRLAATLDERIEPRAFTPESFNLNDPLASVIQDTGIRLV